MAFHTLPAHPSFMLSLLSPVREEHCWETKPPCLPARVSQKRADNQEEQTTVTCRMELAVHCTKGKTAQGIFWLP